MSEFLWRLRRDSVIACALMAAAGFALWPSRPLVGLGVIGGGALIGISYWSISGAVRALLEANPAPGATGELAGGGPRRGARTKGLALVKFVTRHAILALAAYVMMVRLHLDPIGMLVGVSSFGAAAAAEAVRTARTARNRKS